MKYLFSLAFALFVGVISSEAQHKQDLQFGSDGEFKIVQFTDTHINLAKGENLAVYETIAQILPMEKPDLAILTGDIVTEENPEEGFRRLSGLFSDAKVPWAVVFGNHESERGYNRKKLAEFLKTLPYCLNNDKGQVKGNSNFILPVLGQGKKPTALLYCMDSNEYSNLKPTVDGYGWFDFEQIAWYRKNSSRFTQANSGKPLPALAFFHIPLPEYTQAWNNQLIKPIGVKNEDECSPVINSGMFASLLECGDVMGTFVGHDHINDYIGVHCGIALAYGRVTKKMKSADDPTYGGRVIVLRNGKREFNTWIREYEGQEVLECSYPESFKTAQ